MHQTLEIFRLADGLVRHAEARQDLVARNVANADTPGYRAQDIASFEQSYRAGSDDLKMHGSRPGHIDATIDVVIAVPFDTATDAAPNGNSVSIETEMVKASEVRQQHELALSVYKSALGILRTSLGRAR